MSFQRIRQRLTPRRTESITPLLRQNNNDEDVQDGYERQIDDPSDPLTQNTFNTQNEQHLQSDDITLLAEHLRVPADSISVRSYSSEDQPPNLEQRVVPLIQSSVHKHLPKPPEDLDKNLQQHLIHMQKTVLRELQRLAPLSDTQGLVGYLSKCYHDQIIKQLNGVLQQIRSSKSCFVLLQWLLRTYLSQDLLGRPDFMEMDVREIDPMLLVDCIKETQGKLLDLVQKDISMTLENIRLKSQQRGSNSDEDLNETHIDTIQCINAMPFQASKFSSSLSAQVQEICFKELLKFVRRYKSQQTEILEKSKMTKTDTFDFFKTLKTCRELKKHIQTKRNGVSVSLLKEIMELLEDLQDFTRKCLLENVADVTETHLKKYFTANSKQFLLVGALTELFPKLSSCSDELQSVMDEVYKLTVHLYLKHLISTNQKKLVKSWNQNIGDTVTEDAKLIHNALSDLAPGVQRWNFTLLEISEVLRYQDSNALKITVGDMESKCNSRGCTDDLKLLPALLRWKGLSKREVRNILEALPDQKPTTGPAWCFCFSFCW